MHAGQSLVIHEVLPPEVLGFIFEEHAKLEWEAPTIDGLVCRFWGEIVLNTPRVWAYFNFTGSNQPSTKKLHLRLHRSGTAPLYIGIRDEGQQFIDRSVCDPFCDYHTRIASLRIPYGDDNFFERRDFPYLRVLDIAHWTCRSLIEWGSMPELQSLRLNGNTTFVMQLSEFAPLKMLTLSYCPCTSILYHSQSLTTLMLHHVLLKDAIPGPVIFPSLTYLSVWGTRGLKPHINAPSLVTYHEDGDFRNETFSIPLPSLVEYGIYRPHLDPAKWHLPFPNILRLAIRAGQRMLLSFFAILANQPHILPALQTVSVGGTKGQGRLGIGSYQISKRARKGIESLVLVRNEARNVKVVLCFETEAPLQIPMFFGGVSDSSIK